MSTALTNVAIALTINLVGILLIYSLMAFFVTRLRWHGRNVLAVIIMIVLAALFWIAPTMVALQVSPETNASYPVLLGNWLVSAFAIILFSRAANDIPRQFVDSARLDGCGWFGIFWHVVLPLVRRDLGLIALLILMATAPLFWVSFTSLAATQFQLFPD